MMAIVTMIASNLDVPAARAVDSSAPGSASVSRSSPDTAHLENDEFSVDASVRPGDDFYRFANGPWLDTHALPAGSESYGSTAAMVVRSKARVQGLVKDAADSTRPRTTTAARVGDYYAAVLDVTAIQQAALKPLAATFKTIAAIQDRTDLSAYLGTTLRADIDGDNHTDKLFGLSVQAGFTDTSVYYPHLLQGGLGVPNRDFYLASSDKAERSRHAYREYVAAALRAAGVPDADGKSQEVVKLETAIAGVQVSAKDTEDVIKQNNVWRASEFPDRAPGLDWIAFLSSAKLTSARDIIVWQPSAVTGISALVGSVSLESWKAYLYFHAVDHAVAVLPTDVGQAKLVFLAARDGTAPAPTAANARADTAMAMTEAMLGDAVGHLYVERYFPGPNKVAATAMVENIRIAFSRRIPTLAWLSPAQRQEAQEKLAAMTVEVGYPERWTDYSSLRILRRDAFGNLVRAELFHYQQRLRLIGKPVDPAEWAMTPQTVGAVILFNPNSFDFSAAILAPPYFDASGDLASNYGSAGAAMAHEISHSFDELGNQFDSQGRIAPWWTKEDTARYHLAAAPLADQFSNYCPLANTCLNGQQVLAEGVADIAGLEVAHDAYHLALNGSTDEVKDGLTGEQRFFLAFARRWRKIMNDHALRQQIASDIHPPPAARSDEVRNVDAWYDAFGVAPGDQLYLPPDKRVRVW